jgi:hypothetical protein
MVKALFDTNILVDYLNAVPKARIELRSYEEKALSRPRYGIEARQRRG